MKQRVAVLGGGMAGLAAALELSATPERRERYAVTVYQTGWRLGGKCASGRNPEVAQRIEEHGLHVWFGSYENAFYLTRQCYAELNRSMDDAVKGHDAAVLYDIYKGRWSQYVPTFPVLPGEPGDDGKGRGFWHWADASVRTLIAECERHAAERPALHASVAAQAGDVPPGVEDEVGPAPSTSGGFKGLHLAARLVERHAGDHSSGAEERHRSWLSRLLTGVRDLIWDVVAKHHLDDDAVRQFFGRVDVITTMFSGLIDDDVLNKGFDPLNDRDLRKWLRDKGAQEVTLEGAMVRAWYSGAFAFLDGDINKPDAAAGAALNAMVAQQLGYKGHVVYKLQAGMGDVIIAPWYEALLARGVRFEFFTHVTNLGLSPDETAVDRIDLYRQARVREGAPYRPLVPVGALDCWPVAPLLDQLDYGPGFLDAIKNGELDFAAGPPVGEPETLVRGQDFDEVVLAFSVAGLPAITRELAGAGPRFKEMLDGARTTMTQAFQVWLNQDFASLGWEHPELITSTYVEPLDTFCDMTHLIAREQWEPSDQVGGIAYFCGVLPEQPGDTHETTEARVREGAIDYLTRDVPPQWPGAVDDQGCLRWDLLVDRNGANGPARFDSQYWRANFAPTERYVLTPTGSVRHRLWADESGFGNLFLAGDWTRTGLDLGCVEAAVMGGRQAARAILGEDFVVSGEEHARPAPS